MQRAHITILFIAAFIAVISADWIFNVDGCNSPSAFYSGFASNGDCYRHGNSFKKYQCAGTTYNLLTCTDSACTNCKTEKSLPLSGCIANKALLCSTSEPDYSKYAGQSYWVQKFYSTADCSGSISYTSVRGLNTCRSFAGTMYPSYEATCKSNAITYVNYEVSTPNCTANPNIPPQTFKYTAGTCQDKSMSTCVGK